MGYYVKGQLRIFITVRWCVDIKVWYVCTQKCGVRCWDGAVDEGCSCCDICCGSCEFTRVVNYIYSNSEYFYGGFNISVVWCHTLLFHMSLYDPVGLVILEWRILYLIHQWCFPHLAYIWITHWRNICARPFSHILWVGVYIIMQIQSHDGWYHTFLVFLDINLHLVWLWKCGWKFLQISSELGIYLVVAQHQLIFQ